MWARVVELMLGAWLLVSPFVFRHDPAETTLWVRDLSAGAVLVALALLSFHRPTRRAYLLVPPLGLAFAATAWASAAHPLPFALQNEIAIGFLVAMLGIIPVHASKPPEAWRRFLSDPELPRRAPGLWKVKEKRRRRKTMRSRVGFGSALFLLAAALAAPQAASPPRLVVARAPAIPPLAVGGGRVVLEARVEDDGSVRHVETIRATPPYTDSLRDAVAGWRFEPGRAEEGPTATSVLVVGVFRPPAFYEGTTLGEVSVDQRQASADVPVPERMGSPPYPPDAYGNGVAILELTVDAGGNVASVRTASATPGFADVASQTVAGWTFRPARVRGQGTLWTVVAVLGFRQPVVPGEGS